MSCRNGFTLIELLVVIATLALLLSILVPSLQKAQSLARTAVCLNNVRGLSYAMFLFAEEHDGQPAGADYNGGTGFGQKVWTGGPSPSFPECTFIRDGYVKGDGLFHCPESERRRDELYASLSAKWGAGFNWVYHYGGSLGVIGSTKMPSPEDTAAYKSGSPSVRVNRGYRLEQSGHPSETLLIADHTYTADYLDRIGPTYPDRFYYVVTPAHNEGTMTVVSFLDGHVEVVVPEIAGVYPGVLSYVFPR